MKLFKTILTFSIVLCLSFICVACDNQRADEWNVVESFEYHFYPEEYEEKYSEIENSFTLEEDTEYQLRINASCESGIIEVDIYYGDTEKNLEINASNTHNETISIPTNSAGTVAFTININTDTQGEFICEILR